MNYEEFLNKVSEIIDFDKNYGGERQTLNKHPWSKKIGGRPAITSYKWVTGGVTGGSCWNTSETVCYRSLESDPEEEISDLDKTLEAFCPNITFLTYKNICGKVVKYNTWTENEYYGNSTSYSQKYVYLEDLFNELKSRNLLSPTGGLR